jgi:nuclear pore complex protein Nup85
MENAPIGEDLMEWLNMHFIEPSTEEGDHLSGLDSPWEDETFWPYLTRSDNSSESMSSLPQALSFRSILRGLSKASVFFFQVLSKHPAGDLRDLANRLASLIETQPRLHNFSAEREFAHATRRWKDQVKALRIDMDHVDEEERHDGFEHWWDRVSDIISIMEGRPDALNRICRELGTDWKEVCAAWGVFVDARLRGQDVPYVLFTLSFL